MKPEKTNAMRVLDQKKIDYVFHYYADTDAVGGMEIVDVLHEDPDRVFKTLVTVGKSGNHFVFLVPVNRELDLKKAAAAVGEKNVEMVKSKDLLALTGYVHGGCSPIGMKKFFTTTIHRSVNDGDRIFFSAGKIGYQAELASADVIRVFPYTVADLIKEGTEL